MLRSFGWLFWINAICFLAFVGNALFGIERYPMGQYIASSLSLVILFFLPGQNFAALIEKFFKQTLTLLEKLAFVVAVSLIFPPFVFGLLILQFPMYVDLIPIGVALFSWLAATFFAPFFWEEHQKDSSNPHLAPAITIATLVLCMFIFQLTSAYYALPDLDPYYWLQQFQTKFTSPIQISLHEHRPLFFSFGYLFTQVAKVDVYAFFKYIIPGLFLIFLIPAALVANKCRTLLETILIFSLPFASASFILYSTSSLPQSIANLLLLSAFFFILYAGLAHKTFFFFLGGTLLFGSVLYHEMNLLFFLPWLGVCIITYQQRIGEYIRREWIVSILLLVITLSSLESIEPYLLFVSGWLQKIVRMIFQVQSNFAFPATYINIDGNAVGWGDAQGVLRYYAFYFGPFAGFAALLLLTRFFKKPKQLLERWVANHPSTKITVYYFLSSFLIFFSIAEILPRLFNVSLLPERALGFTASLLVFLLGFVFLHSSPIKTILALVLLATVGINIGAALYINSVKQHLITANQIASAGWIHGSLPPEKVFFTGSHRNLLHFHAQVGTVIDIDDPSFYTDIRVFDQALQRIPSANERYEADYSELLQELKRQLILIEKHTSLPDSDTARPLLSEFTLRIQTFLMQHPAVNQVPSRTNIPLLYIYYAKEDLKNPYANRPYVKKRGSDTSHLVFDQFPERFQRIYSLPENEIVIWKVVQ